MKAIFCKAILFLGLCSLPGAQAQTPPAGLNGKTRTYYVAADEVNWDYAPSGRDEAMGMPFDELEKGYTEPGLTGSAACTKKQSIVNIGTVRSRR